MIILLSPILIYFLRDDSSMIYIENISVDYSNWFHLHDRKILFFLIIKYAYH